MSECRVSFRALYLSRLLKSTDLALPTILPGSRYYSVVSSNWQPPKLPFI